MEHCKTIEEVLILIWLEDGLEGTKTIRTNNNSMRLNPYLVGRWFRRDLQQGQSKPVHLVLILIWLEDGLEGRH